MFGKKAAIAAKLAQKLLNKAIQHRNPTPCTGKPYKITSPLFVKHGK